MPPAHLHTPTKSATVHAAVQASLRPPERRRARSLATSPRVIQRCGVPIALARKRPSPQCRYFAFSQTTANTNGQIRFAIRARSSAGPSSQALLARGAAETAGAAGAAFISQDYTFPAAERKARRSRTLDN